MKWARLGRWLSGRPADPELQAEANVLLAAKGRAGALFDLRERLNAVGVERSERRRLEGLIDAVLKGSYRPGRSDKATRMLYRDAGD